MKQRKLGFSELSLTTIGLGTWAIGGGDWRWGWGPQDEQDSIATIQRSLDLGINWIDTAAAYGLGRSEEIVGRAIKGQRDQVIVATKCGLVAQPDGWGVTGRLKAASVRKELEDSLRRLQVEQIDLYQVHWPDPDSDIEEGWSVIAEAVQQGKVRYAGVSNFNIRQIQRAQTIHPVASLQPPYSMINREVEKDLLAYCAANQIGVVAYSPMQSGILTDKFTRQWVSSLAEKDWRRNDPDFTGKKLEANLRLVDGLRQIAARHGRSVGQLAIAWVLRRPEVTSAIVGARNPRQIEETASAGDWELSGEETAEIEKLL